MVDSRIRWIDVCRIICTWGVVCIHTRASDYYLLQEGSVRFNVCMFWGGAFVYCVPVFLMLSGALMIEREISIKEIFYKYLVKVGIMKLASMLISALLCVSVFIRYGDWRFGGVNEAVKNWGTGSYFLGLLGMCYLATPLLHKVCNDKTIEEYLLILCIIFSIIFPAVSDIPYIKTVVNWITDEAQVYFPLGMIFYFILGHYINKYIKKVSKIKIIVLFILIGIVWVWLSIYNIYRKKGFISVFMKATYGYVSLPILIYAIVAFCFFKCCFNKKSKNKLIEKVIDVVAKNSYFIYIFHAPLLNVLKNYFSPNSFKIYSIGVVIETTFVFLVCLAFGSLINILKNKVRRYIVIERKSNVFRHLTLPK